MKKSACPLGKFTSPYFSLSSTAYYTSFSKKRLEMMLVLRATCDKNTLVQRKAPLAPGYRTALSPPTVSLKDTPNDIGSLDLGLSQSGIFHTLLDSFLSRQIPHESNSQTPLMNGRLHTYVKQNIRLFTKLKNASCENN